MSIKRYNMSASGEGMWACASEEEAQQGEWVRYTDHVAQLAAPIPMILHCPACRTQHIDAPSKPVPGDGPEWTNPPHRSHLCHSCGHVWRPADVPTTGVLAIETKGKADSPPSWGTVWGTPQYDEDVNGGRK